jgi:hypothetical protein
MYSVRTINGTYGDSLTLKVEQNPQNVVVFVPELVKHCKGESVFN